MQFTDFSKLILFEDNHLLIINKPGGMLVQGDETGDESVVDYAREYVKEKYSKPGNAYIGLVHRIDRPVSGVVMLTKTSKSLGRMTEAFREKLIEKTYQALVKGLPADEKGTLVHWLQKDGRRNVVTAWQKEKTGAMRSELHYTLLRTYGDHSLLEVRPVTGRPHQIRVQLGKMGCPIKGDLKYGYPAANDDACINLHAKRLTFEHPVTREAMCVEAPLPLKTYWRGI